MIRLVSQPPEVVGPPEVSRQEMVSLIRRLAPADGGHQTAIPSLSLFRASQPTSCEGGLARASLILAAQGQKRITLSGQAYDYGPTKGLISSMDLPVMAQIMSATPEAPYLCVVYDLDLSHISALMAEMKLGVPKTIPEGPALSVCPITAPLFDTVLRLLRLIESPADIPILAPLVERELLYRLLTGEQGMRLRHLTVAESQSHKVVQAIEYLKAHYAEPLRIEGLARQVSMSVSSLHHHFKAVTSMSPLQYQKQLRLHEARRLLTRRVSDVTSAAHSVGYESPSQFSRDYSRLFGAPPTRDIPRPQEGRPF